MTVLTHFHGKIDPFPITYLGIPLGLRKLQKNELQPLVDKVANQLPSLKANLLNKAGRTVLIKSTLSNPNSLHLLSRSLHGLSNGLTRSVGDFCGGELLRLRAVTAYLLGHAFVAHLSSVALVLLIWSAT